MVGGFCIQAFIMGKKTLQFIKCILLVLGWTLFYLQNCINSSWHQLNKVLETIF